MSTGPIARNCRVPHSGTTILLYLGAIVLGITCLTLFVVSLRRTIGRNEEVVTTMLQRYDNRLAEFAQTLNDALNLTLPARITAAISGAPHESTASLDAPDHSNVVRVLELAREQTSADAAVAIVGTNQEPILGDRRPLPERRSLRSEGSASPTIEAPARSRCRSTATTLRMAATRSAADWRFRSSTRRPTPACSLC